MWVKDGCWYRFMMLALAGALMLPAVAGCGAKEEPVPTGPTSAPRPLTDGDRPVSEGGVPTPDLGQPPPMGAQRIEASSETAWVHDATSDSFTNGEIHGSKEWHASLKNLGVPVAQSGVTLASNVAFDYLTTDSLSRMGPPLYGWSFGNVPAGGRASVEAGLGPTSERFKFTPGFDASRSFDNVEFSAPGTQTLTVTVTPREARGRLVIRICASENDYLNPVITSPASGDFAELSLDGHELIIDRMPVEVDNPLTVTVTIRVTPKVPEVEFMPYVWVGWQETISSGSATADSVSCTEEDLGTWTWSVPWSGDWEWEETRSYAIRWIARSGGLAEASNQVLVGFAEELNHSVSGDAFANGEVIGERIWRISSVVNTVDETGAAVTGLGITLASSLAFDGVDPYPPARMGPPTYEWSFSDLVERPQQEGWEVDAMVLLGSSRYPFTITPGFDVFRSFDKTVFSAPDTQTMTVTVTPQEEWLEEVTIAVIALESDLANPVIVSYSLSADGGEANLIPDGHGLYLDHVPVEFGTPLTITAIIQVTPKVPMIEYKPRVSVIPERDVMAHTGTTSGSFVSYAMEEAGTWTVSAEGSYVWNWAAPRSVRGTVSLLEKTNLVEGN